MSQDDRSLQSGGKSFDFNSERGVRDLLKAIRESDVPATVRNELRDLIFMYANGGGDLAVRNILEEQIRSYNIIPLASATSSSSVPGMDSLPVSGFGGSRPEPVFRSSVAPVVKKVVVNTPPPLPTIAAADTEVVAPLTPPQTPTPEPPSISPITPTVPAMTMPAATPASTPFSPTPVPPLEVKREVDAVPVATPVRDILQTQSAEQIPSATMAEYIDRIREIKTQVNNRVGNPVNLISIDKALGNEYMQALLSAMKQLNGGDVDMVTASMAKLESAFKQVMVVIDATATRSAMPTPQTNQVNPTQIIVPTSPEASPLPPPPIPQAPLAAVAVPTIPVPSAFDASPGSAFPDANTVPEFVTPVRPVESEEVSEMARPKIEIRPPVTRAASAAPVAVDVETVPITSTRFNMNTSVASATPLRSIEELPTAASLKNSPNGNPLLTKEVDDGLQQLLAEWGLFKKSGLFGTGPNGREHPLFKKVAPLQIPLLLSGRFEGSTQEIKQSITDYMNGWRYEQGIVYEEGETFETYLRRVIRHIIDWQNKRLGT